MNRRLDASRARTHAVPGAPDAASPSFEEDCLALQAEYSSHKRYLAALRLRSAGERAIEPLCRALRDPSPRVRAAAADTLGYLGDSTVVPALHQALKETMVGGSRGRQHAWVAGVGIITLALCAFLIYGISSPETPALQWVPPAVLAPLMLALVLAPFVFGGSMLWARRHNLARVAVAQALARIAARTGAPELTASLSDLEAMARGGWGQSMDAVLAARRATETIRKAASTGAHPIPAGASRTCAQLPLPTKGSYTTATQLPVAADSTDEHNPD